MKSSNHRDEIFVESFIVGIMPGVINGTSLASKCKTGFLNQLRARSCPRGFLVQSFISKQHHGVILALPVRTFKLLNIKTDRWMRDILTTDIYFVH